MLFKSSGQQVWAQWSPEEQNCHTLCLFGRLHFYSLTSEDLWDFSNPFKDTWRNRLHRVWNVWPTIRLLENSSVYRDVASIFSTFISKWVAAGLEKEIEMGVKALRGFHLAWANDQWRGKGVSWALICNCQAKLTQADIVAGRSEECGSSIAFVAVIKIHFQRVHKAGTQNFPSICLVQQAKTSNYTLPLAPEHICCLHPQNPGGRHLEDEERMGMHLMLQFRDVRHKHESLLWFPQQQPCITPLLLELD